MKIFRHKPRKKSLFIIGGFFLLGAILAIFLIPPEPWYFALLFFMLIASHLAECLGAHHEKMTDSIPADSTALVDIEPVSVLVDVPHLFHARGTAIIGLRRRDNPFRVGVDRRLSFIILHDACHRSFSFSFRRAAQTNTFLILRLDYSKLISIVSALEAFGDTALHESKGLNWPLLEAPKPFFQAISSSLNLPPSSLD